MEAQEAETTVETPRRRWPLWAGMALLVSMAGGGGAWYFSAQSGPAGTDAETGRRGEPIYYTLDENLVVNFREPGRARYLQVGVEVMSRDRRALESVQRHAPAIRNNLVLLLSDQSFEELASREGKERLRAAALTEVQAVMEELHGAPGVESLYFTTFVMQ